MENTPEKNKKTKKLWLESEGWLSQEQMPLDSLGHTKTKQKTMFPTTICNWGSASSVWCHTFSSLQKDIGSRAKLVPNTSCPFRSQKAERSYVNSEKFFRGKSLCSMGNTSSNGWISIVMLVFGGVSWQPELSSHFGNSISYTFSLYSAPPFQSLGRSVRLVARNWKPRNIPEYPTLPETNSSHLKIDGWNTNFLLGWPIFRGYASFRECELWKHPSINLLQVFLWRMGLPQLPQLPQFVGLKKKNNQNPPFSFRSRPLLGAWQQCIKAEKEHQRC